jgi:hypothetical protein
MLKGKVVQTWLSHRYHDQAEGGKIESSVDVVQVDTLVWRLLFLEWSLVVGGYGEGLAVSLLCTEAASLEGVGRQFQDPLEADREDSVWIS